MTNIINFRAARAEKLARDLDRLTTGYEANQEAEQWAALAFGFRFMQVGCDRWGDAVYAVVHDGRMLVDGRIELSLSEALELVRELLKYSSPAQYRPHATAFVNAVAELHAEADAAIEADRE